MSTGLGPLTYDFGDPLGQGSQAALMGGNGFNINNLLTMNNGPAPQANQGSYQPNGAFYTGLQYTQPYGLSDVNSKVNQTVGGPGFAETLQGMSANQGIAHNSPARAYLAAMRSAGNAGRNASIRSQMPLQYASENARFIQGQQLGAANADWQMAGNYQQQGQQGASTLMSLLAPFLGQLMSPE